MFVQGSVQARGSEGKTLQWDVPVPQKYFILFFVQLTSAQKNKIKYFLWTSNAFKCLSKKQQQQKIKKMLPLLVPI
jgi:hypothetical protein